MAILNAPPILRWIIVIPLSIVGIVFIDILFTEKFKIAPLTSLLEFIGVTLDRFFRYATIGAFLTFGAIIAIRFIR